jgi:coenzyme PQQ precursor peptide PqqA
MTNICVRPKKNLERRARGEAEIFLVRVQENLDCGGAAGRLQCVALGTACRRRTAPPMPLRAGSTQETVMQWSTPQHIDFRFGFEITLYVANR